MFHTAKPHKIETPPAIPIPHYKWGDSEGTTVDQASTLRNNIVDVQTPTALIRRFASSDKTPVETFQPDHSGQYAAYEWTLQTVEAADAILPTKIDAVLSMESLYTTNEGVRGWRVLVLTQCDTVRLLQTVSLSALIVHQRIARQIQHIMGDYAYNQALSMQGRRIRLPYPIYVGFPPEEALDKSDIQRLERGEELSLEQCSPLFEAHARSISNP
jgi:hypothetical protein